MLRPLTARDWFTSIRGKVVKLGRMEDRVRDLQEQTGITGQGFDAIGHSPGPKDTDSRVLAAIHAQAQFERYRAALCLELESASAVLYGWDNRGGLAKVRCSADADCVCGYYLQALTWRQVAEEMVKPDSKDGPQWCKRRAYRSLELIDRLGIAYLQNI